MQTIRAPESQDGRKSDLDAVNRAASSKYTVVYSSRFCQSNYFVTDCTPVRLLMMLSAIACFLSELLKGA